MLRCVRAVRLMQNQPRNRTQNADSHGLEARKKPTGHHKRQTHLRRLHPDESSGTRRTRMEQTKTTDSPTPPGHDGMPKRLDTTWLCSQPQRQCRGIPGETRKHTSPTGCWLLHPVRAQSKAVVELSQTQRHWRGCHMDGLRPARTQPARAQRPGSSCHAESA
jgi:hypothetical protein